MNNRGFTLIEIILVVGVIAIIGTLAAFAVNSARAKSRDATRLSQVRMVQSALEDFFNENNTYPLTDLLPLGDISASACLSIEGFKADCTGENTLLSIIPGTITKGLKGESTCGKPARNAICYTHFQEGGEYRMQFELEENWKQVGLLKGINCASPNGIEAGGCR